MIRDKHPGVAEHEAVYRALMHYVDGGGKADIDEVKKGFHERAVMNGVDAEGKCSFGPIENLYELYRQVGPTDARTRVDILDIAGSIAVARITIEGWHGQDFVDYHELVKQDGEWKIVAKVFNQF